MLMPKRVKRRKQFRGYHERKSSSVVTRFHMVSLVLLQQSLAGFRSNQIEAARVAMTRYIKRGGKVWIKIFPDKPVTSKTS